MSDEREQCQCPICGRLHWKLGTPPPGLLKSASVPPILPDDPAERARVTRENADYYYGVLKPFA